MLAKPSWSWALAGACHEDIPHIRGILALPSSGCRVRTAWGPCITLISAEVCNQTVLKTWHIQKAQCHCGWHWHRVQRWAWGPSFTCCHCVCLVFIHPISLSPVRPLCCALWWPRENSSSWTPALLQGPNPANHSQHCDQLSLPLLSGVSIDTPGGGQTVLITDPSLCRKAQPDTVWVWSTWKFRSTEEKNSHKYEYSSLILYWKHASSPL